MPISNLISKEVPLDMSGIPENKWDEAKREVIDLLVNEVLRYSADGISPVAGLGKWKSLNKTYAENEKQGNTTANLRLEGDMMDSLEGQGTDNGVIVGVSESEEDKGDGHCNFTGRSKLPLRRFIPDEDQSFKRPIMQKVNSILDNFRTEQEPTRNPISLRGEVNLPLRESGERIRGLVESMLRRR